ncbi:hypothetical protein BAUCODRAFT_198854 [Baudoinia panamericana UAMH 10762]|uniref:Uncharacterized protein n=1 Tax=Baudoinia panamericana (strain UAMH 10762) TaxID=717646 RepID=M2M240_BAUPA|nr:uncharacterized protein BAUCODRAFT_198854 [Baudoinia panamericana UAMH 10762]EMD01153.1 hypothetical protein BAUCODRAFT_198854 [Baudoinia panamericana UAMH 10762]
MQLRVGVSSNYLSLIWTATLAKKARQVSPHATLSNSGPRLSSMLAKAANTALPAHNGDRKDSALPKRRLVLGECRPQLYVRHSYRNSRLSYAPTLQHRCIPPRPHPTSVMLLPAIASKTSANLARVS